MTEDPEYTGYVFKHYVASNKKRDSVKKVVNRVMDIIHQCKWKEVPGL